MKQLDRIKGIIRRMTEDGGYIGIKKLYYYINLSSIYEYNKLEDGGKIVSYENELGDNSRHNITKYDVIQQLRDEEINNLLGEENEPYPPLFNRSYITGHLRKIGLEKGHCESERMEYHFSDLGYVIPHREWDRKMECNKYIDSRIATYRVSKNGGTSWLDLEPKHIYYDDVLEYENRKGIILNIKKTKNYDHLCKIVDTKLKTYSIVGDLFEKINDYKYNLSSMISNIQRTINGINLFENKSVIEYNNEILILMKNNKKEVENNIKELMDSVDNSLDEYKDSVKINVPDKYIF